MLDLQKEYANQGLCFGLKCLKTQSTLSPLSPLHLRMMSLALSLLFRALEAVSCESYFIQLLAQIMLFLCIPLLISEKVCKLDTYKSKYLFLKCSSYQTAFVCPADSCPWYWKCSDGCCPWCWTVLLLLWLLSMVLNRLVLLGLLILLDQHWVYKTIGTLS